LPNTNIEYALLLALLKDMAISSLVLGPYLSARREGMKAMLNKKYNIGREAKRINFVMNFPMQ
jgi:hypothetical protein